MNHLLVESEKRVIGAQKVPKSEEGILSPPPLLIGCTNNSLELSLMRPT